MQRTEKIEQLGQTDQWDVIVIGGGATGLGTAVDAAARGYRTLLLEAHDFAKGTSSRSTKLVHGGVRYLAQGNVGLVFEALHERGRLRRNAPHVVHTLAFVVPGYTWWSNPWYGLGLALYSFMAGSLGLGWSRLIGRDEVLRLAPTLEPEGLRGGVVYYDGQFDDARLAITLMRTIEDRGGVALNYTPVEGLIKDGAKVVGVRFRDAETGTVHDVRGKAVVNATGVYVDAVRAMDDGNAAPIVAPSQGVHIVLDRSFLPGDHAIMIPKTDDGRVLFAVPWHNRVVVGTTDTPVKDAPVEPRPLEEELQFLLHHAALYLAKDPTPADVLSTYTGLRPLVKHGTGSRTSKLSREHTLIVSSSGLITITGGKWTTYRNMAEDTVNRAIDVAGLTPVACPTRNMRLHGFRRDVEVEPFGVYGADADALRAVCAEQPGWDEPLDARLPYLAGEVIWAVRHEAARTVEDVLSRRTRALLLDAHTSIEIAPRVAHLMAAELGRDGAWVDDQIETYTTLAQGYMLAPNLEGVAAS